MGQPPSGSRIKVKASLTKAVLHCMMCGVYMFSTSSGGFFVRVVRLEGHWRKWWLGCGE
jgi:hypothetical protein